jgi:ABC-type spermidine/putrescine transport system permease subunit II
MGKMKFDASNLLDVACIFICLFLLIPIIVIFISSFDPAKYIHFPPSGFSIIWYQYFFSNANWQKAFMNSFYIATLTTLISSPCGVLAALAYRKYNFKLKSLFNSIVVFPYVTPSLLMGITILMAFSRTFLRGTYYIVAAAHSLWSTSFIYLLMQAALSNYDLTFEEAAVDLGASPWKTFIEVTLPLLKSAIISSVIFGFITSFGEVTMAIFLTTDETVTLPALLWVSLKYELHPVALVASVICIIFATGTMAIIANFVGIETLSKIGAKTEASK